MEKGKRWCHLDDESVPVLVLRLVVLQIVQKHACGWSGDRGKTKALVFQLINNNKKHEAKKKSTNRHSSREHTHAHKNHGRTHSVKTQLSIILHKYCILIGNSGQNNVPTK